MHDPSFLLYDVRPIRLDIWHDEPGSHDAGTVCGWPPGGIRRLVWAAKHVSHLHLRWWPYLNVKKWIVERCEDCGQRFRWREARYSYMSTDKVWHGPCQSLRQSQSHLKDLTDYLRGEADQTARWRVEYRLKNMDDASDETAVR